MKLQIVGAHPLETHPDGSLKNRIGTLFLAQGVLYTCLPGVHALQRVNFIEYLNQQRQATGQPPLSPAEEQQVYDESVDLIFDPGHILIRPNPERMDLAFTADEMLHELVSKRRIQFLSVNDPRVREAIKRRGECWRMNRIPVVSGDKQKMVQANKVAITGLPIYFYNRLTGTRYLTYHEFEKLGALDDATLAHHLQEIADHAVSRNRLGRPELDFFAADLRRFGAKYFTGMRYAEVPPAQMRERYAELLDHFGSCVHEYFRKDECNNRAWCDRMMATLFLEGNETQTEQILSGLSPEFFLHVEWLPGGRMEEGEFMFDPIFDEADAHPEDEDLVHLCDSRAKNIIFNFIREYGDLEYVNLGRIPESLSLERPQKRGRRGVYIAELKTRHHAAPIKRFMRLQKWGVWEHLGEVDPVTHELKDLLRAIQESDEYTDYWLDRRLGCRQLRMNLPSRVYMRRLSEIYEGPNARYRGHLVRTTYFEREYINGIATDKLPLDRYTRAGYAEKLAAMLGTAAACSLIVGRSLDEGKVPVFDDGDEVVLEGPDELPEQLLVGDHSGAFGEYKEPLTKLAAHYARPVNKREKVLTDPAGFGRIYFAAFRAEFLHIQQDYRKRRRAFDCLFKQCKYDEGGSFAFRWKCVLRRLDEADVDVILEAIRAHIPVLGGS